jgi:hypothetical protein
LKGIEQETVFDTKKARFDFDLDARLNSYCLTQTGEGSPIFMKDRSQMVNELSFSNETLAFEVFQNAEGSAGEGSAALRGGRRSDHFGKSPKTGASFVYSNTDRTRWNHTKRRFRNATATESVPDSRFGVSDSTGKDAVYSPGSD